MSDPITWASRTPARTVDATENAVVATSTHAYAAQSGTPRKRSQNRDREHDDALQPIRHHLRPLVAGEQPLTLGSARHPVRRRQDAIDDVIVERRDGVDEGRRPVEEGLW